MDNTLRAYWPQDQLCHSCFYTAMRTRGICPACGHEGVLPGRTDDTDPRPVCLTCADIPGNFTCKTCGREGELHRHGECARCALRHDLCAILLHHPADPAAMQALIEVLCAADRSESILTWKRNQQVLELLGGIASGAIPLTHDGITAAGSGRHVDHLRSLLQHHGLLPQRDEYLARFEVWLAAKLDAIDSPTVRTPVEQFATWHHLKRLRSESKPGQFSDGPKRSAKQGTIAVEGVSGGSRPGFDPRYRWRSCRARLRSARPESGNFVPPRYWLARRGSRRRT